MSADRHLRPELKRWIDFVIVPALVRHFISEMGSDEDIRSARFESEVRVGARSELVGMEDAVETRHGHNSGNRKG